WTSPPWNNPWPWPCKARACTRPPPQKPRFRYLVVSGPKPQGKEAESLERPSSPERQPLEVRFREASSPEEERRKRPRKRLLTTDGESILKGVIWHEILKKPKGW
ncbi:hypothetical protein CSW44_09585, partial [Thermus scotoductus]